MSKLVDVSKLQDGTVIYDKALRALPFVVLSEVASILSLNVMDLQGKHALINERRKAGGTQSYAVGKEIEAITQVLGYDPSVIEPKDVVCVTKENSQKYDDNELLVVGGKPVSNIDKRHPLEQRILIALVRSHAEDIVYQIFHAERDDESKSPSGAFNGFYTHIDAMIASGAIAANKGNYVITGEFGKATTDEAKIAEYEALVKFISSANPHLRSSKSGIPQLLCSETVIKAAREGLRIKLKSFAYPSVEDLVANLREDAFCPALEIATHEALGTGSRLVLQKKGNMDIAFNTQAASKFCQIRDIYEDPNEWQFWLQSGYDTRVRDWHYKVFLTNEQKNTALDLAGDYLLAASNS